MTQKRSGYNQVLLIEVPQSIQDKCQELPLIKALFITKMGFYAKTQPHFYQCPYGINQVIFVYCSGGKGYIHIPGAAKIELKAGDVLIIPRNVPHFCSADLQDPWSIYWFHLDGSYADEIVQAFRAEQDGVLRSVQAGFSEEHHTIFKKLANTFTRGFTVKNLHYANLSFWYYLSTFLTPEHFLDEQTDGLSPTEQAIQFMQQNLSASLRLEQIAKAVYRSSSFLSRKFKADTGYPPIEYYNQLRIQKACQLLRFSTLRVGEIAEQLGIHDLFYFSRLFKQQMGMSPSAYRKRGEG